LERNAQDRAATDRRPRSTHTGRVTPPTLYTGLLRVAEPRVSERSPSFINLKRPVRPVESMCARLAEQRDGHPEDAVRGSPRSSATELEELPLCVGRRDGGRTFVGGRGLVVPVQPTKQIGARGVERVVVVQA